jgi:hypothetical protein
MAALSSVVVACGDDDAGSNIGGGPPVSNTGGVWIAPPPTGSGGSTSGGGASARGGSGPGSACPGIPLDEAPAGAGGGDSTICESVSSEAESQAVDLYIMMDRSVSMAEEVSPGVTRWDAIREAVEAFVTSPDAGDIGAGIGFFGKSSGGDDELDCDPDNYAVPDVEIGPLSEVGEALVDAIADTVPSGFTPTLPALEGAIRYAQSWAEDNPDRASMVLLVTDGYPTQCDGAIDQVAAAARDAAEADPRVRTFVIGLDGTQNLDGIARAGGTSNAFVVESAEIADSLVSVLLNITSAQLACSYVLPPSPDDDLEIDRDRIQVVYTPESTGEPEEVPRIDSPAACDRQENGGWYFSGAGIAVCPCTCARFGAGRVDVRVGCQPIIGLR